MSWTHTTNNARDCDHRVDVVPGCHKGAELFLINPPRAQQPRILPYNGESAIAFHQVTAFLQECGTRFDFNRYTLSEQLTDQNQLLHNYREHMRNISAKTRAMHFGNKVITKENETYHMKPTSDEVSLNLFHQALRGHEPNPDTCLLTVQDPNLQAMHKSSAKPLVFSAMAVGVGVAAYSGYQRAFEESISQDTCPESTSSCRIN